MTPEQKQYLTMDVFEELLALNTNDDGQINNKKQLLHEINCNIACAVEDAVAAAKEELKADYDFAVDQLNRAIR